VKPEQADLLRKARESLDAAKLMQQNGYDDFAAARAYYSMFYIAEAFLLDHGPAFSKHSAVHAAFGEHFARTGIVPAEFHRYLIHGMELRHTGDYDYAKKVSPAQAAEQIAHAEEFCEAAARRLGPIPPSTDES